MCNAEFRTQRLRAGFQSRGTALSHEILNLSELCDLLGTRAGDRKSEGARVRASSAALLAATIIPIVAMIGVLTAATILLCHGHFIYSLDDPYISLSFAWHIGRGDYGLNPHEAASPASSILYPLLLALFSWTRHQQFMPLVINGMAAAGTAAIFAFVFREVPRSPRQESTSCAPRI